VSINASATEFADPTFVQDLAELLVRLDLNPSTSPAGDHRRHLPRSDRKRDRHGRAGATPGVRIALDDFGTGYSSLSYINRYPIDTIKIDRSFVSGMVANERTFAVVDLVVSLGRKLGVAIVAEGVETAEQAEALAGIGCGFGQGYHFARPEQARVAGALLTW
jgi:EAL domain-containing protein (putative c-di-GMP-specific phosphodiesterase class I)